MSSRTQFKQIKLRPSGCIWINTSILGIYLLHSHAIENYRATVYTFIIIIILIIYYYYYYYHHHHYSLLQMIQFNFSVTKNSLLLANSDN